MSTTPTDEPTMEEILASIRKIICEDDPAAKAEAAPPAAPQPEPVLEPEPAPVEEVLDLTDELQEPQEPPEPVMAAPAPLDDIAFAPIDDAEPIAQPMEEPVDHDDFISDATRGAVGRSLSHLDSLDASRMSVSATPPSGSLDALFTHAVQDAMAPVLQQWVRDNSGDIINQLNPIIREWMDHNLPDLIESAVRREISRRGR